MIQSLQGSAVALRIVDTESGEKLKHLLLHLAAVGVQGWKKIIYLETIRARELGRD